MSSGGAALWEGEVLDRITESSVLEKTSMIIQSNSYVYCSPENETRKKKGEKKAAAPAYSLQSTSLRAAAKAYHNGAFILKSNVRNSAKCFKDVFLFT